MNYKIQQSEKKYRGRAFDVRWDKISLPNGKSTKLDIVEHANSVTILPIDTDGHIWFVRQYRHPAGIELLELPAGVLEPDEDPVTSANRELQEEIGMGSGSLQKIGGFFLAPGYSTEFMYVYLARDLFPSILPHDDDEFLSVERLPQDQVRDMVRNGVIQDAKTLAVLYMAKLHP